MINIDDITDDMVYLVLSKMEGINRSAYMEMREKANENKMYLTITDKVKSISGKSEWSSAGDIVMNEAFINSIIDDRPNTNDVLIGLGVLSFWSRIEKKVVKDDE